MTSPCRVSTNEFPQPVIGICPCNVFSWKRVLSGMGQLMAVWRAVIDAGYAAGYQAFTDYQERIAAEHGPGIAEATA